MYLIDWITMSQHHEAMEGQLPIIDGACIMKAKRISLDINDYEFEWASKTKYQVKGSYDTSIQVKCDGSTVWIDGNVGRFNRRDNVFGFDIDQVVEICNRIVGSLGLPPFTKGKVFLNPDMSKPSEMYSTTGATISKLDITRNYATGSAENAQTFIDYLRTLSMSHVRQGQMQDTTVYWGGRGSRKNVKAYIKHLEMAKHAKSKVERLKIKNSKIYKYCERVGLVRIEHTISRKTLFDTGLRFLSNVTMAKLIKLFDERANELLGRVKTDLKSFDLADLPNPLQNTAILYFEGYNMKKRLPKSTYYRHLKQLKAYGIDISVEHLHAKELSPKIVNINVSPIMELPDFYQLDVNRPVLRVVNG